MSNQSFISQFDLNLQKHLLGQKSLLTSFRVLLKTKHKKPYTRSLFTHKDLYKGNSQQQRITIRTSDSYNITNSNFYTTHENWYSKKLQLVGQSMSDFSMDLKSDDTLTITQPLTIESFKFELKSKRRRSSAQRLVKKYSKKSPEIFGNTSSNFVKPTNFRKKLNHFRKNNYKLTLSSNSNPSNKFLLTSKNVLRQKTIKNILRKQLGFKKNRKHTHKLTSKHQLRRVVRLMSALKQRLFKSKYISSVFFQNESTLPNPRHQNAYAYCNKPRLTEVNFDSSDYMSLTLTNLLDNPKSSFVKRSLAKLPIKLKKVKHFKWFPHFSKKHNKLYLLRYSNRLTSMLKINQPQWPRLRIAPNSMFNPHSRVTKQRYTKYKTKNLTTYKSTQPTMMLGSGGFAKWGLRIGASPKVIQKTNQKGVRRQALLTTRSVSVSLKTSNIKRSKIKSSLTQPKASNPLEFTKFNPYLIKTLRLKRALNVSKWLFIQKKHTSFFKTQNVSALKSAKTMHNVFTTRKPITLKSPNFLRSKLVGTTANYIKTSKYIHRVKQNVTFDSVQPIHLYSRINKPFILNSSLMFFTKMIFKTKNKPFNYKYMFKKKLFSFLYPNEVRNALLYKKKQFVFYKLIFDKNKKLNNSDFYSTRKLKKLFNYNNFQTNLNNQYDFFSNTSLLKNATLSNNRMTPKSSNFAHFTHEISEVEDHENFKLRGTNNSFKIAEVKIPRIQFKPGYQRLWRRARTALKESLQVKFLYQQKLSRYIVRFFRQTNYYTFSRSEMELQKTIIYSRLLPDIPTVSIFLTQSLVYLNGRSVTNPKTTVLQNDVIQFIVSQWYYIAFRWIANWTLKRNKKFKRLVYRKGLASRHKVMKLKKQKSYYTPHWIYLARYDISDIKSYLEVDYLTLSACVIYNPYLLHYFAPDETPDWRATIYRLYNWKYIT